MAITDKLLKYIPQEAVDITSDLFRKYDFTLTITKPRRTKLGDYRAPFGDKGHRISVNGDLNKFLFLITFLHEIAHLTVNEKYGKKTVPHGKEWKVEFKNILLPFLNALIFPEEILQALNIYIQNPSAGSCTDIKLLRALRRYNTEEEFIHLEELEEGTVFSLKSGRKFIKGKKIRKLYLCEEARTGIKYRINPLAETIPEPAPLRLFA